MTKEDLLALLSDIFEYDILIALIAPYVVGDASLHLLGVLSGEGLLDLKIFFIFPILSVLVVEALIFYFVRHKGVIHRLIERHSKKEEILRKIRIIQEKFHGKDFWILAISKILPGTRLITIAYIGVCNISFRKFIFIESFLIVVWVYFIVGSGYLVGSKVLGEPFSENLNDFLIYAAAIIALILLISYSLNRYLFK